MTNLKKSGKYQAKFQIKGLLSFVKSCIFFETCLSIFFCKKTYIIYKGRKNVSVKIIRCVFEKPRYVFDKTINPIICRRNNS